jgi:hypothetical protein
MAITFNHNDKLYVSGSNVGIGTDSPGYKLDIEGNARIKGGYLRIGTVSTNYLGTDGVNVYLRTNSAHYFEGNGFQKGIWNSSGNLGIGTISPLGKLQVNEYTVGANGNQSVHGELSVFANSGDESLFLGVKNASYPNRGWAFNTVAYGVNSNLQIKEHGSTAVRMTIQSGGNVGIGSTSPSDKLEVIGNIGIGSNMIYNGASSNSAALDFTGARANIYGYYGIHFYSSTAGVGGQTERMRITNTGLVGIGTTSPGAKLDITTDHTSQIPIRVTHNNYNDWLIQKRRSDDTQKLGIKEVNSNGGMGFATADTVRMVIDSSGNVGIGTTSPGRQLELRGQGVIRLNAISGGDPGLDFNTSDVNDMQIRYRSTTDALAIYSYGTSSDVLTIRKSDGNVGIGTTSPSEALHIYRNAASAEIRLQNNTISSYIRSNTDNLNFYVSNGEKMRITSAGNVGIGTTSPVAKLHIQGTNSTNGGIRLHNAGGNPYSIWSDNNNFYISQGNGSTTAISVTYAGNVGIGTTSPASKLHVNGNVTIGNIGTTAPQEPLMVKTKSDAYFPAIKVEDYNSEEGLYIQNIDGYNTGIGTGRYYNSGFWRSDLTVPTSIRFDQGVIRFYAQSGVTADADYTPSERMRIAANGNVGIGTTSPSYKLSVNGDIQIPQNEYIYFDNTAHYIRRGSSDVEIQGFNGLQLRTNGSTRLYINQSGNVGIGTTTISGQEGAANGTPKLQVLKTGTTGSYDLVARFGTDQDENNSGASVLINAGNDRGLLVSAGRADSNRAIAHLNLIQYDGSELTDGLTIYQKDAGSPGATSGTNVGIGTTSPDTKLHIYESAAAPVLLTLNNYQSDINPNGSQGNFIDFKMTDDNATFTPQVRIGMIVKDSDGDSGLISEGCGNFVVYTAEGTDQAGNGTLTEHFRITDKGNVGIGTTSPAQKLHVKGHIRADYNDTDGSAYLTGFGVEFERGTNYLRPRAADGTQTLILGGGGDTLDWNNIQFKTSGYINFRMSGSDVFRINSSGNVGIGTTSPGRKLHVDNASGVGEAVISGTTGATLYFRPNASYSAAGNFGIFTTGLTSGTYESTMIIKGYSSAITDVMTIKGSGNVGIGTTSPSYNLDVNGNINATGFYIGGINQIAGTEYIAPLARTGTWTRDAGTSPSDEWVKVISYNGGPRRIRLWLNHGGDNTNMYDEYLISHSSYGMQTHIYRLPGSKYNTSKVLGIKVINSSGAVQDVWVKLAGIASGSGSFVYRSNVTVESSTNVAASATATEPSGTTGSSVLYISDSNRNEFTTMSSGGGYFGGNISIGTASPTANLHITSSGTPIKMSRSGYDDYGFVQSAGTGLQIQNFTDNRTEMFFDGGGNIGMGTTSPKSQLHIYKSNTGGIGGELRLDNNGLAVANKTRILFSDAGGNSASFDRAAIVVETENSPYNGQFQFQTGFGTLTTKMIISGAGNVGIGTTGPNQKLHVEGAIYAGTANSTSGSLILVGKYNNGNIITIGGGYSAGGAVIGYGVKPSTTAAGAFLSSSALANLERSAYVQHGSTHQWWTGAYQTVAVDSAATLSQVMTLDGSGNLGIGTTSPSVPLHVVGTHSTNVQKMFFSAGTSKALQLDKVDQIYMDNGAALYLQNSGSGNIIMTGGGGNVGIGTTSPSYKLHVDNDASNTNNAALYVRNPNSSSGAVIAQFVGDSDAIQIKNINVGDYAIYNTQQSNGIALYDGTGGVEIHYNGATVLEADSNGGIKVTGQLSATGDVVAYSSDERLKENIKPIENAVNKIKQLKGVTFDWNEKSQELGFEPSTKTNDVGVIAQDVEAVFPQLVHLAPFDIGSDEEGKATSKTGEDYKTVNYARLTAVLIEAVKEQQQQIDELKEIINGLTK